MEIESLAQARQALGPGPVIRRPRNEQRLNFTEFAYAIGTVVAALEKGFPPQMVITVNRGGAVVGGMIARYFRLRRIDRLDVVSPGTRPWPPEYEALQSVADLYVDHGPKVAMRRGPWTDELNDSGPIARALVVDDVFRTGATVTEALRRSKQHFADQELNVATKAAALVVTLLEPNNPEDERCQPPDFFAIETTNANIALPWYPGGEQLV